MSDVDALEDTSVAEINMAIDVLESLKDTMERGSDEYADVSQTIHYLEGERSLKVD